MITREQVEKYLEDVYDDEWDELYPINTSQAEDALVDLHVDYPRERVEWYNSTKLYLDDLVRLGNVSFYTETCVECGEKAYIGCPENYRDFQGVYSPVRMGCYTVQGREGLKTVYLCSGCVPNWLIV